MSNIIERVESDVAEWDEVVSRCSECRKISLYDAEGEPCEDSECNGVLNSEVIHCVQKVPGYIAIRCSCGDEVRCDSFTNTCYSCGADYNHSGARLAPRSQWGEETGETAADLLGI